jgi:hypothetical protein
MKIPLKFPVAESMFKTFRMAPPSLCQIEGRGNEPCAEDAAVDAMTRPRAMVKRYMFLLQAGRDEPMVRFVMLGSQGMIEAVQDRKPVPGRGPLVVI